MRGGGTTDLVKDFGNSVVSSIGSVFEPIEVYASEQEVTMGDIVVLFDTSTGTITGYISGEGHLEIPEKINGVTVKSIMYNAFFENMKITSITIPNSISIDGSEFISCIGLTFINVDSSNPNYTSKDGVLFSKDLKTLVSYPKGKTGHYTIPDSVTSIGDSVFSSCSGLISITIPDSVTSIGKWAFAGCSGLTSINIPNSVTSIGFGAFIVCDGLTSINIPNSMTSIGYGAFSGCTGLTSINIPNSVTSIGNEAFRGCTGLTSINIPNSVTSIGDKAFSECTGLTSITISDSVTSIGNSAFSGCTGLTSITIPNSVTSIGDSVFSGCTGLTFINVDSSNPNYTSKDGVLFSNDLKTLVSYPKGKTGHYTIPDSVTSIGDNAFSECTGLTSINIPNSVISIGNFAFSGCSGLTSINIPNSVTSIGYTAFSECTGLTSINISNSVTSIGDSAFRGCTGLTSITIPNGVTGIAPSTFNDCIGLTSITIPSSVSFMGVAGLGSAFSGCIGLKDIYYSGTESQWNKIVSYDTHNLKDATIHYNSTAPSTSSGNSTGSSSPNQPPSAPKVDGINFKIGQTTSVMDVAPYVENGNTMIPVRAMAELLGISDDKIIYDSATNKVTIIYYERVISLTIGDNKLYVTENGSTSIKTMDNNATAVSKDWRTFVPVRALSEAFGLQVGWDNNTQTVTLSS